MDIVHFILFFIIHRSQGVVKYHCAHETFGGNYLGFSFSWLHNKKCATYVSKSEFMKWLHNEKHIGLETTVSYCRRHFKNGHLAFFDPKFLGSFGLEFLDTSSLLRDSELLTIHAGFQIVDEPRVVDAKVTIPEFNSTLHLEVDSFPMKHRILSVPTDIMHHNLIMRIHHAGYKENYFLDLSAIAENFRNNDSYQYPLGVSVILKKSRDSRLKFTDWFAASEQKWDGILCTHDAYQSCYNLLSTDRCYFFLSTNSCAYHDVLYGAFAEYPYGKKCEFSAKPASCECPKCAGLWSAWTKWSSECGYAYRIRYRKPMNNSTVECFKRKSNCCFELNENRKPPCTEFSANSLQSLLISNCLNNGVRKLDQHGIEFCKCPYGFTGIYCEHKLNCSKFHCLNGAVCDKNTGNCKCQKGFSGLLCEKANPLCVDQICPTHSTCIELKNHYGCQCGVPFNSSQVDQRCGIDYDRCSQNPCTHGAQCHDKPFGFSCVCPPGWTNTRCEIQMNSCAYEPCQNKGVCVQQSFNSFICKCLRGFSGRSCEIVPDLCIHTPCKNGGTCVLTNKGYRCKCTDEFTDALCGTEISTCRDRPCSNGGICVEHKQRHRCRCLFYFRGPHCEQIDPKRKKIVQQYIKQLATSCVIQLSLSSIAIFFCIAIIFFIEMKRIQNRSKPSYPKKKIVFVTDETKERKQTGFEASNRRSHTSSMSIQSDSI